MKNNLYLFLAIVCCFNGVFAQLKPIKYKDGTQVLNGFGIQPTKKSQQNPEY